MKFVLTFLVVGLIVLKPQSRLEAQEACQDLRFETVSVLQIPQQVGVKICDVDVKMTLQSTPEEAAKIGLRGNDVLFEGNLNQEIPGVEGKLMVPGPCGLLQMNAQGTFTGIWTVQDLASEIAFEFVLPTYDQNCNPVGSNPYASRFVLDRVNLAPGSAKVQGGKLLPDEGCQVFSVVEAGSAGRTIRLCKESSGFSGTFESVAAEYAAQGASKGDPFLVGNVSGLDGSIEATGYIYNQECGVIGYRLTGATNEPGLEPVLFLEGHQPQIAPGCGVESYRSVRLQLLPQ